MNISNLLIIPERADIKESMRLAKEYGCGFEYNDFFSPKILDDKESLETIAALYETQELPRGCTSHGAFLDVTIFSDDSKIRGVSDLRVEQSLKIGQRLGVKGVVFHTNYLPNFVLKSYQDQWVERNAVYWREKLRKYSDMEIYIENMFDAQPALIARLGEALRDEERFGLCFDYAHAHAFGDAERIDEWVTMLAPYVKHMHINDNDFVSDLHLPIGAGKIDWLKFKHYYETYMSDVSVLVEVSGNDNIKASLEYLQSL